MRFVQNADCSNKKRFCSAFYGRRSGLSSGLIVALISLVLLFSLCMLPFSGSAETPATLAYTLKSDGSYPTASVLDVMEVSIWPMMFSNTWGSDPQYSVYNLETSQQINRGIPYIIDYDVDFTDGVVELPYGGYFEVIIAPREQYNFVGFGYDFTSSNDPNGYSPLDHSGTLSLSSGEIIEFGEYYDTLQVGSSYNGYRFRVPLPEGDYRITNFHINALFLGINVSEKYNIMISDFMVYKYGSSNPLEQEDYTPPETGAVDDYEQAEGALKDAISGNEETLASYFQFDWGAWGGIETALVGVSGIYRSLLVHLPWLERLIAISVSLGLVAFLFSIASSLVRRSK